MHNKKIPMRTCCGCGEMKPKKELIRVVKTPKGDILLDFTGKKSGRGAYICRNIQCLEIAKKTRKFERSFSYAVSDELYEVMKNELAAENS